MSYYGHYFYLALYIPPKLPLSLNLVLSIDPSSTSPLHFISSIYYLISNGIVVLAVQIVKNGLKKYTVVQLEITQ